MASLNKRGKAWSVQFRDRNRKKWTIGLGTVTKRTAEEIRGYLNRIVEAHLTATSLSPQAAAWLGEINPDLRAKIAATGVCPAGVASSSLKAACDRYVELKRGTVGASTLTRLKMSTRDLVEKLGANTSIDRITDADAIEFRRWLLVDKDRAEATTRKRCGDARSIFAHAIKAKQIEHNPFLAVPVAAIATKHHHFLPPAEARKVMAELPNLQWRLLFALARWGGLRVPSEPRGLVWADVLWDKGRFRVEGKTGERWVPLFPEIVEPMREAFEAAEPGAVRVLPFMATCYNGGAVRHPLERAIRRAGLTLWPRLWHNLRSTRQTELEETFPSHVVCRWLGNSTQVARSHYLQVTDDHFTRAAALPQALPAAAVDERAPAETGKGKPVKAR